MNKHHSIDYKLSAVKYYLKHGDLRYTCKIFDCSKSSLHRWVKRYLKYGTVRRKKNKIKVTYSNAFIIFIDSFIRKHPNVTIAQLTKIANKKFKTKYNYINIYRLVKKINITNKKLRKRYFPAKGDEKAELKAFYKIVLKQDIDKIISIDETSFYINMTRGYGWSKKGRRAYLKTRIYPFKRYNVLSAIKYGKVIAVKIYEEKGGLNVDKFNAFINRYIKGKYKNHLIIMDNVVFHRSLKVRRNIIRSKNKYIYSVRYNPITNPIEGFFNQLKHYLKLKSPQSIEELKNETKYALKYKIKRKHLENYFKVLFLRGKLMLKK